MTTATAKYHVVKTVIQVIPAEHSKTGKAIATEMHFFYKHGAWLADWINDCASQLTKAQANKIARRLNKENQNQMIVFSVEAV